MCLHSEQTGRLCWAVAVVLWVAACLCEAGLGGLAQVASEYSLMVPVEPEAGLPVSSLTTRLEAASRHELLRLKAHSVLTGERRCWVFTLAQTLQALAK